MHNSEHVVLYHFLHALGNRFRIFRGETIISRKRKNTTGDVFRDRTSAAGVDVRREVRQERIEVATREDIALLFEFGVDLFARGEVFEEDGAVGVIRRLADVLDRITIRKCRGIGRVDLVAPGEEIIDFVEAKATHKRLKLIHLRVRTDIHALSLALDRKVAELGELGLDRRILKDEHAAFAGVKELSRMKREHRHRAFNTDRLTRGFFDAKGVRGIVDYGDTVLLGETIEALDVAHVAVDMDGNDCFRARRYELLRGFGRETQGLGVNVGENRCSADTLQSMRGGDESKRRCNDITTRKSHRIVTELERERAVIKERDVLDRHLEVVGETLLEALEDGSVVREPLVGPNLFAPLLELLKFGEVRPRH